MNKKASKPATLIIIVFVVIFLICSLSGSIPVSLAVACLCAFPVSLAIFIIKTLKKQKSMSYLFSSIGLVIAFILFLAIAPTTDNNKELETTTTEITTETTTEETTTTTVATTTSTTTTETTTVEITTEPPTSAPVVSSNNSSSSYNDSAVSDNSTANTVYIGKTGSKYHRQTCRTLKGNGSAISLSDAKSQGRTACKICKP